MPVPALGFGDFECGAGIEQGRDAAGDGGVHRAAVRVQQVTHAERLFFFDYNGLVPAERCAHPAIFAHVPVRWVTWIFQIILVTQETNLKLIIVD